MIAAIATLAVIEPRKRPSRRSAGSAREHETASDWLARAIDSVVAVLGSGTVLGALLLAQLLARAYRPWLYWGAVAMVSVFGTMAADVTHVVLRVPYVVSTLGFGLCVAALLIIWSV